MLSLDLQGRTALVGGSTQGIGLASAQALASQGAACVLISRNEASLKKALDTLDSSRGQSHQYLVADFSQPDMVHEVVSGFIASRTVHILINNSGGPSAGPVTEADPEDFQKAFNQHLICNQILAKLVLPGMKKERFGRIINIISTSVKIPLKNLGVSNTIRGAVANWSKTLSNEVASFGITVNNVLPGATETARLKAIIRSQIEKTGQSEEAVVEKMVSEIPARRFGRPEELAALVGFLASPAAAYINGTSIPVDGGRTGSL